MDHDFTLIHSGNLICHSRGKQSIFSVLPIFSLSLFFLLLLLLSYLPQLEKGPPSVSPCGCSMTHVILCLFPYSALMYPNCGPVRFLCIVLNYSYGLYGPKDFKHSHVNTVMKQILLSCRPSLSTRQSFIDIRLVSCFYKQFVCLDFTYRASFNQIFSVGSICLVLLVCAFIRPLLLTIPSFFFLTG